MFPSFTWEQRQLFSTFYKFLEFLVLNSPNYKFLGEFRIRFLHQNEGFAREKVEILPSLISHPV